MTFAPRYTLRRAEDIAEGADACVFAAAQAIRHIQSCHGGAVTSTGTKREPDFDVDAKKPSSLTHAYQRALSVVMPSNLVAQQQRQQEQQQTAGSARQPVRRARPASNSAASPTDPAARVAASYDTAISVCRSKAQPKKTPALNGITSLPNHGGIMLSASELTRLQSNVTVHHVTSARSEPQGVVYDKMMDRLTRQRVDFVNECVAHKR